MPASLRQFLTVNGYDPAAGVLHLLPPAVGGSTLYLFTNADQLLPGQQLAAYRQLVSSSRLFNLIMQDDGNLVLYRTMFALPLWASNTNGTPVDHAVMQADGNLVACSAQGVSYWATNTAGHPGADVLMQDDGNAVVYDNARSPLWASDTVQDLSSPTVRYFDNRGYEFDETAEGWKQKCMAFPCFAGLAWPGYATHVVDDVIDGEPVVIQLWKGTCQKFLGLDNFPGGIGAEVGVYHVVPGRAVTGSLSFLPADFVEQILDAIEDLSGKELWWAFPELGTRVEFTLTNPVTQQTFFSAGPEVTYWMNKWMFSGSYTQYRNDQGGQVPASPTDYVLNYRINGKSYPAW
jgi:hypothetical protein